MSSEARSGEDWAGLKTGARSNGVACPGRGVVGLGAAAGAAAALGRFAVRRVSWGTREREGRTWGCRLSSAEEELVVASEGEEGLTGERGPHVRVILLVAKEGRAALYSSRRLFRREVTELSVREVF